MSPRDRVIGSTDEVPLVQRQEPMPSGNIGVRLAKGIGLVSLASALIAFAEINLPSEFPTWLAILGLNVLMICYLFVNRPRWFRHHQSRD